MDGQWVVIEWRYANGRYSMEQRTFRDYDVAVNVLARKQKNGAVITALVRERKDGHGSRAH